MNKSTKSLLMWGAGAAALYYLYQSGALSGLLAGVNPANQETPAELTASTNSTIQAQLNAFSAGT